ncbi:MAG: class I SAM-dependent methyltransferase [Candidatus Thorarchaeota archaeon]
MKASYYNQLAEDYNHKRQKPWKALEEFLNSIEYNELKSPRYCLDIGCGNGRNFPLISLNSHHIVGLDNSLELLKRAQKNFINQFKGSFENSAHIQLVLCTIKSIPIRTSAIGGAFLIAVIHHIKGRKTRRNIMHQIYKIIENKGWLILSVWRKYQKKYRWYFLKDLIMRKFLPKYKNLQNQAELQEFGDKIIPWTVSKESKTYPRFYHFFSYKEAKGLMSIFEITRMEKLGGSGKKDNFFFFLFKRS